VNSVFSGVLAAVLTPFRDNLDIDINSYAAHCRWLLDNGCDGLSVLGTTGEANSVSVDERLRALDGLASAGIPGHVLMPGTGCCAIPDTIRLTAKALEIGAGGVLMLPPFYYKTVSDDGLFAAYASVIEAIGDPRLKIYVYNFPQMVGFPIRPSLIERLIARYPRTVIGMKDSSGDGEAMAATARAYPGFAVFTGSDEFLLPLLEAGGAGCITGICNLASPYLAEIYAAWREADHHTAARAQTRINTIRAVISRFPLTAALKVLMADHGGSAGWRNIRPPLAQLPAPDIAELGSSLDRLGFSPPPLR